jgi:glycosyltransferase involved in cell wall biosynthesis
MRILYCNYEYPPLGGGGGVINKQIAEELAKRHDIDVLTSQGMGLPSERIENGVTVYRVPVYFRSRQAAANMPSMLAYLPSGYWQGRKLIREKNYDVINTHFVIPTGPLGDWLAAKAKIPNVLSVHGGDLFDPSKWMSPHRHSLLRSIVRRLLRKADAVVGQSSNTINNVHDFYYPDIECECIPLGFVRPDNLNRVPRNRYGLSDDDLVLVTVGRLVSRKALDQLIEILAQLNNDKIHLFIIGSGPQEQSLKTIVHEQNLAKQVRFLGQIDEQEKLEVLRMSDVYASTSQHEGFGIVYLEAMAAGLPVICYDYGGQTDFLESGISGYVVKLNDKTEFIGACQRLLGDQALRSKMGKHNLLAVEKFYIDHCANQYEKLYEKVIEQHRG